MRIAAKRIIPEIIPRWKHLRASTAPLSAKVPFAVNECSWPPGELVLFQCARGNVHTQRIIRSVHLRSSPAPFAFRRFSVRRDGFASFVDVAFSIVPLVREVLPRRRFPFFVSPADGFSLLNWEEENGVKA